MDLIKAVDAYLAYSILAKENLPFKDSLKISAQRKKLKPLYELFAEEEKKIVFSVSKKDTEGNPIRHSDGHFEFIDDKAIAEYKEKMSELSMFDIGAVETIELTAPEKVTAELIEALEGFAVFKEVSNECTP